MGIQASALVLLPRTIPAQPPLDSFRCVTCGNTFETGSVRAFRDGYFASLSREIIDPACDCPFPNNVIPQSRLLPYGAWPEDIYLANRRSLSFSDGSQHVAEGWTPLHEAMRQGSFLHPTSRLNPAAVEPLLASYDVNARIANGSFKGSTPVLLAARHGRSAGVVGLLLAGGAEVDAPDARGFTPLLHAARPEVFDLLVAAGADIRARSNGGITALHRAANALPAAQVEALLAAGLDPNAQTDSGWSPLLYASSAEAFEALVAAGADIRARSNSGYNSGYTALHRAASSLPAAQVEALLAAGLDPNAQTDRGLTALHFAGSAEAFEALVAAGADIAALEAHFDRDLEEARAAATDFRNPSSAEYRIRNSFTVRVIGKFASPSSVARLSAVNPQFVNWPDSFESSIPRFVLHHAAESGEDPALIDALVAAGAVVDPESTRRSPLALAAANRSARAPEIVNALLAAGAEVNPSSEPSPLFVAAGNPSAQAVEIVNALLAAGAAPNPQDSRRVPVYAAAMAKNSEAVEALVAAGARVENVGASTHYYTLLADVLSRRRFDCGYAPVAAALQAAGAVSLASDPGGGGSLPFVPGPQVAACSFLSPRIARLIDSGADLEARDASGQTELHRAASGENLADVEALIDAGADVNATSLGLRLTPLQLAAARGAGPSILQALLDGGAEVGAKDIRGWTALHRAARESRDPAVFETLVAGGADVNATDHRGLTPLEHARLPEIRNEAAIAVLEAAGQP